MCAAPFALKGSTMEVKSGKAPKRALIVLGILAVIAIALALTAFWWTSSYYLADETALVVIADANGDVDGVVVKDLDGKAIAFVPDNPIAGLVFYPGAKVQPEAYAPLMQQCAERGILCVIVKPLFNLALLDVNAADGIQARFPDVKEWIIAGHSLGGIAACSYVGHHAGDYEGIALLASYPTNDLSSFEGSIVTLLGTEDHVVNKKGLEDAEPLLPDTAERIVVEGGNHAYFGNYGEQEGDGTATISREQQQKEAADAIEALAKAA